MIRRLPSVLLLTCTLLFASSSAVSPGDIGARAQEMPEAGSPLPRAPDAEPGIVGGEEAEPGAWPWMAALVFSSEPNAYRGAFCGGVLIAAQWVLTAAHCAERSQPSDIDVVIGRLILSGSGGERISVSEIVRHPSYNRRTMDSDIALLRLVSASSQPTIRSIDADEESLFAPGTMATVTGWGLTDPDDESSYTDELRQVSVPVVSNAVCNAPQAYGGDVTSNMLCAGYAQGGQDSCSGDSGGPLMVPNAQGIGWLHAAIVSWADGCAEPHKYGVYTRVADFTQWIESHVGPLPTATLAPTSTPTSPPADTSTPTATVTPARSLTPIPTNTASVTATVSPTHTPTQAPSDTPTSTATVTPTSTSTHTSTATADPVQHRRYLPLLMRDEVVRPLG